MTLIVRNHDPGKVEIVCYSDASLQDEVTLRVQQSAHAWRNVFELSNSQLAQQIRADQIDILVDLALHTAENRLPVFARKPAPVQVTWLGYPGTSGMRNMDYRLTDPFIDPPGENDQFYTEKSIRLPHCFWCYDPGESAPEVNRLPALDNGFVTLGCFNGFGKVGAATRRLWIDVMHAMPTSRLIFLCPPGEHRKSLQKMFENEGVSSDRLEPVPRLSSAEYFRVHQRIDFCLDPTPYSGHTTTCDALWMGIPTVTLRGRTAVGRGAASILSNVGLMDWIAQTPQQYVSVAMTMASDLPKLAELRSVLRERMRHSPLMNGRQYASDLEAAYRAMWQSWCAK
jgi:predicted O-linked N-acetylglucosamine transferase (SPINDLY family)